MDASMLWGQDLAELRLQLVHKRLPQTIAFRNLNSGGDLTSANETYERFGTPLGGLTRLLLWSVAAYGIAFVSLRNRERG